jgi:hypothetical protein
MQNHLRVGEDLRGIAERIVGAAILDNVGVDFDIGATLGVGGGFSVDVSIDPTFWN